MKKFLAYFSVTLKTAFTYKARGFVWFLLDIFPMIFIMLFFSAVYSQRDLIGSYSFNSILIYYLTALCLNVLVISHPEYDIAEHINQGFLSSFLIKPLSYIKYYLANEVAYKVVRITNLIFLIIIVLNFVPDFSHVFRLTVSEWIRLLLMMLLAFNIYSFFKFLIGFLAFWLTEISWILGAWDLLNLLFSGMLILIDLMPKTFQKIAAILPFKYLIYAPVQLLLQKSTIKEQLFSLIIQGFWLIFLIFLTKKVWRKGVRIYSAFGN